MKGVILLGSAENWRGELVGEEQHTEATEWYWSNADCKERCREVLIYRKFFTSPKPPVTDEHFIVRVGEDETIECYSTGDCLISLEPKVTTETRYYPSFWDRLKALFLS